MSSYHVDPVPPLFAQRELPPHNGTVSSISGAKAATAFDDDQHAAVLACIKSAGVTGATNQEIEDRTGIAEKCVCARTNTLAKRGAIMKRVGRRASKFRDGHESSIEHQVWIVV